MKLPEKDGGGSGQRFVFFPLLAHKFAKHFEPIMGFKYMIVPQAVLGACFHQDSKDTDCSGKEPQVAKISESKGDSKDVSKEEAGPKDTLRVSASQVFSHCHRFSGVLKARNSNNIFCQVSSSMYVILSGVWCFSSECSQHKIRG